MNIEQRLAESIRAFHTSRRVPLNVDLDVALTVLPAPPAPPSAAASPATTTPPPTPCNARFLSTPGTITTAPETITVRLDRRTYSPVLRQADHPDTTIPWWGNRTLHFEYD